MCHAISSPREDRHPLDWIIRVVLVPVDEEVLARGPRHVMGRGRNLGSVGQSSDAMRFYLVSHRNTAAFPTGVDAPVQYGPEIIAHLVYLHAYQMNSPAAWSLRDRGGGFRDRSRRFLAH